MLRRLSLKGKSKEIKFSKNSLEDLFLNLQKAKGLFKLAKKTPAKVDISRALSCDISTPQLPYLN